MKLASSAATVMAFLTLVSICRSVSAFVPASRTFATKTGATGIRRKQPSKSGDTALLLVEKLQREQGRFRDFRYGQFLQSTDVEESKIAELPVVFPQEGKVIDDQPPRMRFAPSPTGSLHVGGARTALYNWLVAKKGQIDYPKGDGGFVLRVEDTDVARSTRESEISVLDDLRWLGLHWDEGPDVTGAPYAPYRQSERGDLYFAAAQKLLQEGKAYRCFCSPEELEEMKEEQLARGETPRYDGRWRDADIAEVNKMLDQKIPYTVRFKVSDNSRVVIDDIVRGTVSWDAQATVGDFILLRSSGIPVYNFCVAVDDATMGITTVVRAEEHLTNTLRQALILDALHAPRPRYAHCSLILGEDKQKLSKRHGATSCDQYRLDGFLPDAMINYLALLGWNDGTDTEIFTREDLIDAFELSRVVKSPSVFDIEKLKWVNSQHIKTTPVEKLLPLVIDQLTWEGLLKDEVTSEDQRLLDFAFAATTIAKQMMETTKDALLNAKTIVGYSLPATFAELTDAEAKAMIELGNFYKIAMKMVEQFESKSFPLPDPSNPLAAFKDAEGQAIEEDSKKGITCKFTQDYMAHMKLLAKEVGVKGKNLFHPIRLALTGEMSGQDVTKQLSLVAMATAEESVIDFEKCEVVDFESRMHRLNAFCESIPEELRSPRSHDKAKSATAAAKSKTETDKEVSLQLNGEESSASKDPKDSYDGPPISALDIRVGIVNKVWEHPEADKLYCEEIDVGEEEPRQVASGLRPFLKAEDIEGRRVLLLCNLKSRNLVGFPSHGMVLCASNADHTEVKLVCPPIDAKVGERITVPDFDFEGEDSKPFAENKIGKKKILEALAPFLVTSKYGVPEFLGRPFMTSAGVCTSPIQEGSVS